MLLHAIRKEQKKKTGKKEKHLERQKLLPFIAYSLLVFCITYKIFKTILT